MHCCKIHDRRYVVVKTGEGGRGGSGVNVMKYDVKRDGNWFVNAPLVGTRTTQQSTLSRPEVHSLYIHFNVSSPFVLHVWGRMIICITCD